MEPIYWPEPIYTETARRLSALDPGPLSVLCGLDGFVDQLARVVDQRSPEGVRWIETLAQLGQRIQAAAGQSTNLEWVPLVTKLGGNGPIMARALRAQGVGVSYVGALGAPLHPVFEELAHHGPCFSVGQPGETLALEFQDGKLILGQMQALQQLNYPALQAALGPGVWHQLLSKAQALALTNWTMLPHMGEIFQHLLQVDLPGLAERPEVFFFDLADPAKRSLEDLHTALKQIGQFEGFGRTFLGLNLKEARQVAACLGAQPEGLEEPASTAAGASTAAHQAERALAGAASLRKILQIDTVVIHARGWSCAASREHQAALPGPFCGRPRWTTGAGDHFNAGVLAGQLLRLPLQSALAQAMATSGYYVRHGESPSWTQLLEFLKVCGPDACE